MKLRMLMVTTLALAVTSAVQAGETKGLGLKLRAAPRVGIAGTPVVFTASLTGGTDGEDLYCLTEEWHWDDGSVSTNEGECDAWVAGETKVERTFIADRTFNKEGKPEVTLVLRKGDKTLVRASISLTVARKPENSFEIK